MNRDVIDAIQKEPERALDIAYRNISHSWDFLTAISHDIDIHTHVAKVLTGRKEVSKKVRQQYKEYTFYLRYGAFTRVPASILGRYRKHFPELFKLGEKTGNKVREKREAREAVRLKREQETQNAFIQSGAALRHEATLRVTMRTKKNKAT